MLPQKLVRPHGFREGEPTVVSPNVHDVCVYLSRDWGADKKSAVAENTRTLEAGQAQAGTEEPRPGVASNRCD